MPSSRVGRRGAARLRLHIPADLVLVDCNLRCLLDDISLTGARLAVPREVASGVDALLSCRTPAGVLECFGRVVWSAGKGCGLLFDEPLAQGEVLALRDFGEHIDEVQRAERRRAAREWIAGGQYRIT